MRPWISDRGQEIKGPNANPKVNMERTRISSALFVMCSEVAIWGSDEEMMVEVSVFINTKADVQMVALHFRALVQFLGFSLSSGESHVTNWGSSGCEPSGFAVIEDDTGFSISLVSVRIEFTRGKPFSFDTYRTQTNNQTQRLDIPRHNHMIAPYGLCLHFAYIVIPWMRPLLCLQTLPFQVGILINLAVSLVPTMR